MSRLPFEFFLALRYLRPKRTFVSVITLISILGVTLGVAVLIIVISVMSGFDRQLRETILGFDSHMRVIELNPDTGRPQPMNFYADAEQLVRSNPEVRGVAPFVLGQVLLETQQEGQEQLVAAPYVRGIDPEKEKEVSVVGDSLVLGTFDLEGRGLLIGTEFARSLDLYVGDRVAISSPNDLQKMRKARESDEELAIPPDDYEIRGIFDVGYYDFNAFTIVTSLENAQDLYNLDDSVHGLLVMLNDPYQADTVKLELKELMGPGFTFSTWTEDNSMILDALLVEKHVMFYILFFIMIVAAFGITSAQITFVVQKTREIGMLKALGATNPQITGLFLSQSAFVGVVGVIAGYGLGMLALHYRNEFLHLMNRATGFELFPAQIYGFTELPALIVPGDIAIICGGSFIICILAGMLPAWNAGRLNPVDSLRHE